MSAKNTAYAPGPCRTLGLSSSHFTTTSTIWSRLTPAGRQKLGRLLMMARPSPDHYLPALAIAGASNDRDSVLFMTESIDIASVSMRSFVYY